MSVSLQQNVDATINERRKQLRQCLGKEKDNILNMYCELVMRLKKSWTNKVLNIVNS